MDFDDLVVKIFWTIVLIGFLGGAALVGFIWLLVHFFG